NSVSAHQVFDIFPVKGLAPQALHVALPGCESGPRVFRGSEAPIGLTSKELDIVLKPGNYDSKEEEDVDK
ncbi:hypothetical protein U1Q18_047342, partial [Sarracenia purpurea var. burkii]